MRFDEMASHIRRRYGIRPLPQHVARRLATAAMRQRFHVEVEETMLAVWREHKDDWVTFDVRR